MVPLESINFYRFAHNLLLQLHVIEKKVFSLSLWSDSWNRWNTYIAPWKSQPLDFLYSIMIIYIPHQNLLMRFPPSSLFQSCYFKENNEKVSILFIYYQNESFIITSPQNTLTVFMGLWSLFTLQGTATFQLLNIQI